MHDPQTKADLVAQLAQVQQQISSSVAQMTPEQFNAGTAEEWSAAGYLKHLILSVKPLAKALQLPPERLREMFGTPDHPSRSYAEFTALYNQRLADGVRAEDMDRVVPTFYRFPEGVTDEKAYLLETWDESNRRLLDAVAQWDEGALDSYQLPHPALGMVTLREMLFFTVHHNMMHSRDIERVVS